MSFGFFNRLPQIKDSINVNLRRLPRSGGTCEGAAFRVRSSYDGTSRVLAFHLRQGYGGLAGLAFLPLASRMIRPNR